jgi:N-acetylglutamate synthase-like GNAT family acetyltransferase
LNTCSADFSLSPALASDYKKLSELALCSKAYWGYDQEFLDKCQQELSYSEAQIDSLKFNFVVATHSTHTLGQREIIGFYAIDFSYKPNPELEALFVLPNKIGQGVGKALIKAALIDAKKQGSTTLAIQGDPNATQFYLAAGGIQVGELESQSIPGRFLPLFEIPLSP